MAEYIDREVLIENLERFAWEHYNINAPLLAQLITKQPAADVVEVRRGEWEDSYSIKISGLTKAYPSVKCSNCGVIFCDLINNHRYMYHFCPNCGADMRGESDGRLRSSKD